jgi:AcrR family transcriptional regulator
MRCGTDVLTVRKIRDPAARERIVEVAAAVIASEGLHGATMRGIASAAGVSTGYITHYFEDKHALVVEALQRTNAIAARRVLKASASGSGLERLRAAVDAMLPVDRARRQEWHVWISVWGQASPGDAFGKSYRAGWAGLRSIFAELLEQAIREGDLRVDIDTTYEAERLVTMLAGVGLLAGVQPAAKVREAATRMLAEQVTSLRDLPVRNRSAA